MDLTQVETEQPVDEVASAQVTSAVLLGIMAAVFMVSAEAIPYGLFQLVYGPLPG